MELVFLDGTEEMWGGGAGYGVSTYVELVAGRHVYETKGDSWTGASASLTPSWFSPSGYALFCGALRLSHRCSNRLGILDLSSFLLVQNGACVCV